MMFSFGSKSSIDKRLKRLQKQLSSVQADIDALARKRPGSPMRPTSPATSVGRTQPLPADVNGTHPSNGAFPAEDAAEMQKPDDETGRLRKRPVIHDERFAEYLTSSFQHTEPLGQEREVQRNKAILMAIFVILIFILLLYKFAVS